MAVELGGAFYEFDVTFEKGVAALKIINSETGKTEKILKDFDIQAKKVARSVNGALTQNIQNASFQFQDFFVQIASGQSALTALIQQLPQLLGGIGLLGAGVATSVAVIGGLYTILGDTTSNMEKLEKAIENVQAVITVGAGQVANYTEEMQKLAGLSETLARLRLATAIADQNEAIKLSIEGIRDSLNDTRGSFDTYTDQVENLLGVQAGTNGFAAAEMAFRQYSAAVSTFSSSGDVERLESSLLALTEAGAQNTAIGRQLISQTVELIQRYREGQITIEALDEAIHGNTQEIIENNNAYNALNDELDTYFDLESGLFSADYKQRISDVNDELDQYFEREKAISDLQNQRARQQAENVANRVIDRGLSEDERFAQEIETLTQLRQQNLIDQQLYDQAIVSSVKQRTDAVNKLQEGLEFVDWESFSNRAAGALATGLAGFQSMEDAVRGLGQSLITEALGSLIKYGIKQAAISAGFISSKAAETAAVTAAVSTQAAAATAATAATTTAGVASGAAIAAAMAPAAAASSIATAGAAPAAAAPIALSTTGAIIAALVGGLALSGARQFGGGVTQGSAYRVGENNMPELYRLPNGKLGMIPGENGRVIPMDGMMGGQTKVEIYNYSGAQVKQSQSDDGRITRVVIGEIARQISTGNGLVPKAMRANTNLDFQGNR